MRTEDRVAVARARLDKAERKFAAALATAHRTGLVPGELDHAYEGAVNGIILTAEAYDGLYGGRRAGEGQMPTLVRSICLELHRGGFRPPSDVVLADHVSERNASVHGDTIVSIDTESVEEAATLGREFAAAVRRAIEQQQRSAAA